MNFKKSSKSDNNYIKGKIKNKIYEGFAASSTNSENSYTYLGKKYCAGNN